MGPGIPGGHGGRTLGQVPTSSPGPGGAAHWAVGIPSCARPAISRVELYHGCLPTQLLVFLRPQRLRAMPVSTGQRGGHVQTSRLSPQP